MTYYMGKSSLPDSSADEAAAAEPEADIVLRARQGCSEAFGKLVRMHRRIAYSWAAGITRDHHMAEDIVQDALIRAFLSLGTLTEDSRFVPWLHRIVRNQAMMKLRRGGPYGKEQPFTSLTPSAVKDASGVDWDHLDSILAFIALEPDQPSLPGSAPQASWLPEERLIRKETVRFIVSLLDCLTVKERSFVEAHFFRQLTPQEIAGLFNTTTANVYKTISRSRQKLQQERIRIHVTDYVEQRAHAGHNRRVLLDSSKIRF
ncbi:ECF RNA polymerase sigma factor SigW [Paenibacillus konkukensis]|uniref:RNA polymerase sigma factor n=2 Tax=Paenibacillus konkukensis TaxID=2020716 RepID=A0ABY4RV71_9BACL|nr:ECF RNA polymerase sigma factor SigW [Paenibacillus konkukensis]